MKKKILLAEDHDDSRSFLKFMLELDGYEVVEVTNGQQAVQYAESGEIDLLLMDISMPDMSGLTAIEQIRKCAASKNVPAIALSAYGNSFHEKAFKAGFDYFVDKPINIAALEPILERYLGKVKIK